MDSLKLPWRALLLHRQDATPTAPPSDRFTRIFYRDGRVERNGAIEGRADETWLAELRRLIAEHDSAVRELLPPADAGPGPTCLGTHHLIVVREGFRKRAIEISDFDWTGRTRPPLLAFLVNWESSAK